MTFASLYAIVVLICSQLRPGENVAYEAMKGIFPEMPNPAATAAIFCSATPSSKYRSGNLFANAMTRVDSVTSAQSATTFRFASPAATRPSPNPSRVGFCSTSLSNSFGFSFAAGFSIIIILPYFVNTSVFRISCATWLFATGKERFWFSLGVGKSNRSASVPWAT